jgi:Lipase C-terminal domain/AF_1763-like, C-terminal domain/Lipase (class 2)
MLRKLFAVLLAVVVPVTLSASAAQAHPSRHGPPRPVVFVHGFSGGAQQFETQARRFASNGYPADRIEAHEYDSTFTVNTVEQVYAGLDARIGRLLARTGADAVDLTAHSLGTALMQGYLNSSPARAARVAHYVNYDGASAAAPPGGVPTLAIWGEGDPARAIVGATNVRFSDQSHTQTVTSAESFATVYRFLTGRAPRTTRIVPELPGQLRLSGRAVLFPLNVGVPAGRLEVYPVSGLTGHRLTRRPAAVFPLAGDGAWGPFRALPFAHYEFAIVRDGAITHHFYYQPFVRSDRLIRLLTSLPGQGLGERTERSAATTNLIVNRGKEWWGDQGAGSDVLAVNGTNVLTAAIAPRTKRVIAVFTYDVGLDGRTDLTGPIPFFFGQPFITGADVRVSASAGGAGRVSLVSRQRGGTSRRDVLNVPNWPSTTDSISVQFNDYLN